MVSAASDDELPRGIARFWGADGQVVGCGFLIAERTLCTCSHVVASALGTDERAPAGPPLPVMVDFPLLTPSSARVRATVFQWRPVTSDGGGDIALLNLEKAVEGTIPVRFAGGTAVWDHAFRVLGFPSRTDDHGVWVDGRLRAPVGKGWTSMEARPAPGRPPIGRGYSGGPVWDTDQGGVVGMTVAAETGTGATTAYLIPAALLLGLDPSLRPSPFRGLEPFREQDAGLFFARREDSERIARAVQRQPFVPVAGASGVGKSSLVRAGVLPLLRAAGYSVTDFVGQPGAEPVGTLLAALRHQFPEARLPGELGVRLAPQTVVLIGARILDHCGPAGHVVVLDQFEETVGAEPVHARDLLDTLLIMATARHPEGRHFRVLTTLRSASLEDLAAEGGAERLSVTVQMVAPMTPSQLGEIVRRPLEAVPGVDFETGLADRIVTAAGSGPGALPLVEFALARLWENRQHGRLTHAAYCELGGVEGALAAYADQQLAEVCKGPDGPGEAAARQLFEQLTLPDGEQGYARVARAYAVLPSHLRVAAQVLAATRLLVIGRDSAGRETVALAHESLVWQWPRLRAWLDESRAFRAWQERLRLRLRDWEDGGRHPDLLLRGRELTVARTQMSARAAELDTAESAFIDRSRRHRRRTARRGRAGMALVTVLAVLAGSLVFFVRWEIGKAEQREREEAANELAVRSLDRSATDPVESAALAVLAHRTAHTEKTYRALLSAYPALSMVRSIHEGFLAGRVMALASSADGGRVALLEEDNDGGARGFVVTGLAAGKPSKQPIHGLPEGIDTVAVSDDGSRVAVAGPQGQGMVWSTATRSTLDQWSARTGDLGRVTRALDFSADGRRLLHATHANADGTCIHGVQGKYMRLDVRDTKTRRNVRLPSGLLHPDRCLNDIALPAGKRSDDQLILTSESDETRAYPYNATVRVRALGPGLERREWNKTALDSVLLGAGGRTLGVQGSTEFDGAYWDPATGTRAGTAGTYRAENLREQTGRFAGADAGFAVLWHDTENGADHVTLDPSAPSAWDDTDCSESGVNLVTPSARGGLLMHVLCGRDLLSLTVRPARSLPAVHSTAHAEFAPSGRSWAVLGSSTASALPQQRFTVSVFAGERLREQRVAPGVASNVHKIRVVHSADGRRLVVWGELGWVLYEVRATGLEPVEHHLEDPVDPDRDPVVRDVRALNGQDFLLMDKHGIRQLRGNGRMASAYAPDCGETNPHSIAYCLAVAVSPKQDGTAWLLRKDGTLTSWDPDDGGERRHTLSVGLPADGFDPRGLRFRDDGKRLAVVLRDRTALLDPATRRVESRMPTPLMSGVVAYADDGHMVFVKREEGVTNFGKIEVWSDDGTEPLADLGELWTEGAWRFDNGTLHTAGRWGSWSFPLDEDTLVVRLCRILGDYNPPRLHERVRRGSYRGTPCRVPR
ncbi:trypsin-like peptidase domain-containing protein [Streptomyces sp. NPDC056462]|uniref:nSTAND1 domain-containing NTPase n=1 Tax=Streptomyces sp. NPDC056462 TaxID=3345826 RepID=UPI0036B792DC